MLSIITGLYGPTPRWSIMIMIDFGSIIQDSDDMNFYGCSDCLSCVFRVGHRGACSLLTCTGYMAEQQCSLVL